MAFCLMSFAVKLHGEVFFFTAVYQTKVTNNTSIPYEK